VTHPVIEATTTPPQVYGFVSVNLEPVYPSIPNIDLFINDSDHSAQ